MDHGSILKRAARSKGEIFRHKYLSGMNFPVVPFYYNLLRKKTFFRLRGTSMSV